MLRFRAHSDNNPKFYSMVDIAAVYNQVQGKIDELEHLNKDYKENQEKQFLKTFAKVMNKMGEDLCLAQQAYQNIDKEIEEDEKCLKMAAEVKFFRDECFYLRAELKRVKQQLKEEKAKSHSLEKEKQAFETLLRKKTKRFQALENKSMNRTFDLKSLIHLKESQGMDAAFQAAEQHLYLDLSNGIYKSKAANRIPNVVLHNVYNAKEHRPGVDRRGEIKSQDKTREHNSGGNSRDNHIYSFRHSSRSRAQKQLISRQVKARDRTNLSDQLTYKA